MTEDTAVDHLVEACRRNGYLEDDGERIVYAVINSSLRAGMRNPRNPSEAEPAVVVPQVAIQGTRVCDRWASIETELKRRLEVGYEPFPSPITGLNSVLGGGCVPGGVTLVCAAPGAGKSSLCLQWGEKVARSGRTLSETKTQRKPPVWMIPAINGEAIAAVTGATAATSPIPRGNLVASAQAIHVSVPIPRPRPPGCPTGSGSWERKRIPRLPTPPTRGHRSGSDDGAGADVRRRTPPDRNCPPGRC